MKYKEQESNESNIESPEVNKETPEGKKNPKEELMLAYQTIIECKLRMIQDCVETITNALSDIKKLTDEDDN